MVVRSEFPTTMADSDLSVSSNPTSRRERVGRKPLFFHLFHMSTLGDELVFMYRTF